MTEWQETAKQYLDMYQSCKTECDQLRQALEEAIIGYAKLRNAVINNHFPDNWEAQTEKYLEKWRLALKGGE